MRLVCVLALAALVQAQDFGPLADCSQAMVVTDSGARYVVAPGPHGAPAYLYNGSRAFAR
jgi:hypothetical protein